MTTAIRIESTTSLVQWGTVVLDLDNEEFRQGFLRGRSYYFEDISGEEPARATRLNVHDMLSQAVGCNPVTGAYHLDAEGLARPVEYLGLFLGYMHGPLSPETPQEAQARQARARQETIMEEQ